MKVFHIIKMKDLSKPPKGFLKSTNKFCLLKITYIPGGSHPGLVKRFGQILPPSWLLDSYTEDLAYQFPRSSRTHILWLVLYRHPSDVKSSSLTVAVTLLPAKIGVQPC